VPVAARLEWHQQIRHGSQGITTDTTVKIAATLSRMRRKRRLVFFRVRPKQTVVSMSTALMLDNLLRDRQGDLLIMRCEQLIITFLSSRYGIARSAIWLFRLRIGRDARPAVQCCFPVRSARRIYFPPYRPAQRQPARRPPLQQDVAIRHGDHQGPFGSASATDSGRCSL